MQTNGTDEVEKILDNSETAILDALLVQSTKQDLANTDTDISNNKNKNSLETQKQGSGKALKQHKSFLSKLSPNLTNQPKINFNKKSKPASKKTESTKSSLNENKRNVINKPSIPPKEESSPGVALTVDPAFSKANTNEQDTYFKNETNESTMKLNKQESASNNQEVSSSNQKIKSNNQEIKSDNQEIKSDNQEIKSDNQEIKSDNQEIKPIRQEIKPNNQKTKSNNQILKSNNQELKTSNLEMTKIDKISPFMETNISDLSGIESWKPVKFQDIDALDVFNTSYNKKKKESPTKPKVLIDSGINSSKISTKTKPKHVSYNKHSNSTQFEDNIFDNQEDARKLSIESTENHILSPVLENRLPISELNTTKPFSLSPFSDSHIIEEQIYFIITFIFLLTKTITLFKRTTRSKVPKLGHFLLHVSIITRFILNCVMLNLSKIFPSGKQILEEQFFISAPSFLNIFKYKINLTTTINALRLMTDTVFISSIFLFASNYFLSIDSSSSFINGSYTENKRTSFLKRSFILYSILRIPLLHILFAVYALAPTSTVTIFSLEILFLSLFLFTQSIKLSVSKTSPATKSIYSSLLLLIMYGTLRFGRFLNPAFSPSGNHWWINFVIYKICFFVYLLFTFYLSEMFLKRTKLDFYEYYDDVTSCASNKGVKYYVGRLE
ncbi:hypothetical protein CDIK_2566 [Cucumispora dikerogammari]|nr:hypothetical protein CDIK_2566 [Cucumispora dikerogammari]